MSFQSPISVSGVFTSVAKAAPLVIAAIVGEPVLLGVALGGALVFAGIWGAKLVAESFREGGRA